MAKRKCKAKLLYPHINWGGGGWQNDGCLETFTGRETTLFCPRCCKQIYRLRTIGDMGIEHEENLYNPSESLRKQMIPQKPKKKNDSVEIAPRSKKRVYNARTLQWVSADRLPEAINTILDQFH